MIFSKLKNKECNAFLIIYNENRKLWEELFDGDDYHPSVKGTHLVARVLYHAILSKTNTNTTTTNATIATISDIPNMGSMTKVEGDTLYDPWMETENYDEECAYFWEVSKRANLEWRLG